MNNLFNKEDINEVARLVSELKAIVGHGYEEYRGIMTIDVGYHESFKPVVLVSNDLLDKNFKSIKSDGDKRYIMISGVKFFSVGNR